MSAIQERLAESAALLELLEGEKESDRTLSAEIVARELTELEQDILRDPGACERLLVPVRTRRSEAELKLRRRPDGNR
jgi:hypothetical protein